MIPHFMVLYLYTDLTDKGVIETGNNTDTLNTFM